jgi:GrpB-like predicted nucleotidyltransferase (UPF0157 family)
MLAAPIAVVEYDAQWPHSFESERGLLEQMLTPWLEGGIHHIGSTSVPGLAAKPVIDMIAGVRDLDEARGAFDTLLAHGYHFAPHRPEAHRFAKPSLTQSTHGLHLTEPGSALWRERLAFRDALRGDAALAAEYQSLKQRLAVEHPRDIRAYTDGKRAFVARVLAAAGVQLQAR